MSFVTGWLAAAGLAAASIPVIIHLLLRRRRKPMFWGGYGAVAGSDSSPTSAHTT